MLRNKLLSNEEVDSLSKLPLKITYTPNHIEKVLQLILEPI